MYSAEDSNFTYWNAITEQWEDELNPGDYTLAKHKKDGQLWQVDGTTEFGLPNWTIVDSKPLIQGWLFNG